VVAFVARYEDLIVWTTLPQGVARPENVAAATALGVELAAGTEVGPWSLSGSATLNRARDATDDPAYAGNQLPRVPLVDLWAEGAVRWGSVALAVDVDAVAGTFADTANLEPRPARLFLGATAGVALREDLRVELAAENLLDTISARVARDPLVDDGIRVPAAIVDHTGYPLPGRTVTCSVRVGF
jgi:outer membrane receptor protein involved in Fe transport